MNNPKTKPLFHFILCLALEVTTYFLFPKYDVLLFPFNLVGLIFIFFGIMLTYQTWQVFKQYQISYKFEEPAQLITDGPLKYSRNPMYVGKVLFLWGVAFLFGNFITLCVPFLFVIVIQTVFIPYEEKVLEKIFGEEYLKYKKKVRRWF